MNEAAFNALLKTLEEPPPQTVILLLTHAPSRLPATLVSRCRLWTLALPTREQALAWLSQNCADIEPGKLKKALAVNWGAPLQAQAWLQAKADVFEAQWQQDLHQLAHQKQAVGPTVEQWLKQAKLTEVLDYFYWWTVQRVRAAIYQNKLAMNPHWLAFQQSLLYAKSQAQTQINPAILLESVVVDWLALADESFVPSLGLQPPWQNRVED